MSSEEEVYIERQPYTHAEFDKLYRKQETRLSFFKDVSNKLQCSSTLIYSCVLRLFPIIEMLRFYNFRPDFLADFLGGITTVLFHIPHALAFGMLASVKIENGFYTSIWPVLFYVFFGTSKHVSIGTSAVVCFFTACIINQNIEYSEAFDLTNSTTEITLDTYKQKENIAAGVALLTGVLLVLIGVMQFGFVLHILSEPLMKGFTSGAAIHILVHEANDLLGIESNYQVGIFRLSYTISHIFENLLQVNGPTLLVSVLSIVVLLTVTKLEGRKYKSVFTFPIPADLFVVFVAVVISSTTNLEKEVKVIGPIVSNVPRPFVPDLSNCQNYILDCFILALVIYANHHSICRVFAKKHNYIAVPDHEILSVGICNFAGAFFHCIPVSASFQRSKILSVMNVKSTLSGVVVAILMFFTLHISNYIFESLPRATIAAIIVVSLRGLLIQIAVVYSLWCVNKFDFCIWVSTFLTVLILDLKLGFLVGVVVSLIAIVVQSQIARGYRVGRITDQILIEHKKYRRSKETNGIKVFRFHSNLYFANAEIFRNTLYRKTVNPRKLLKYMKKQERNRIKQLKIGNNCSEDGSGLTECNSNIGNFVNIISEVPPIIIKSRDTISMNSDGCNVVSDQFNDTPSSTSISSVSCVTDDTEEVDPEDGQCYVSQKKFEKMRQVHHIIVDCSTINYMDITGAHMIGHISNDYSNVNIKMFIAGCNSDIQKTMMEAGVFDNIQIEHMFIDVCDALVAARQRSC